MPTAREWALIVGGIALGVLGPALALKLLWGYDSFSVWHTCYVKHAAFSQRFGRTYAPWFMANPLEMLLFMGVPVSCLVLWAAVRDAANWWRKEGRPFVLLWALLLVVALLHVSGKNLGEVARLWMLLMPFGAVIAGWAIARLDRRRGLAAGLCLAALYLQTAAFRASLEVLQLP